jgi:hypothetical protein
MDYLAQPKLWKMDMRFGTWNVRSLYRSGSLKTVIMDLREIGLGGVDWIQLSQDGPVAGCCECGDESSGSCATELVIVHSYDPVMLINIVKCVK